MFCAYVLGTKKSQSSNILAVYDWFEVVCSGEVSWQVSGVWELRNLNM